MRPHPHPRGFTLIELLLVVAIIGIITTILVPNLLDALQKAKQRATVGDIREAGAAWFSWLTDQISAATSGQQNTYDFGMLGTHLTGQQLLQTLYVSEDLFYARSVPPKDGWGHAIDYAWSGDVLSSQVLGIRSYGRDGGPDASAPTYTVGPFAATAYDMDIVWADGLFVRFPLGSKVN